MRRGYGSGTPRPAAARRRRQLVDTAARCFHRHGFHGVAMADVARQVGITAPALYRHFRSKKALLATVVESGLDLVDAALERSGRPLADVLFNLAGAALERRDLWALLQREARHLDEPERLAVRARFNALVAGLTARIRAERPEADEGQLSLLVTAVLGVLASPSVSGLRVPAQDYQRILTAAGVAVAQAELPDSRPTSVSAAAKQEPVPWPRSEQLLETAITLFHDHGYAAVTLDRIAVEVGLTGPSIYYHFATKSDLLVSAFSRAAHQLAAKRVRRADDAELDALVHAYIDLGVRQRQLFGVYVTEAVNLPPEDGRRIRTELTANVADWATALRRRRPELSEPASLVLVHAARGIVNDVVRVGGLHTRTNIGAELETLAHAALNVELPRAVGHRDPA
ncbi:TetR/AcrR family transcriptional regulator [Amycolatopsis sp. K13G38]|uniref:TetR/AcrR family transcriptional regulator n=1 Tax=Amycolatopsis acididurans TaxID=2724524 RepID=A0ABX1IXN8_9PSEU|nr:TetR/AcrR family transcriptional regulator [Amycolatopsis acididurans]NKQ51941.1 TetR/AcrR family transcriptional regulator [Amycolatopsis acididurans]